MRRWLVLLGMLLLGIGYVVHAVAFRPHAEEPTLRAVRTFGDLRSGEPFVLSPFDRLWVGISAYEVSEDSAVVVYLWFERERWEAPPFAPAQARVEVHVNGEPVRDAGGPVGQRGGAAFHTRSIHPGPHDALRVEVVTPDGDLLADAPVRVTAGGPRFWRVLRQTEYAPAGIDMAFVGFEHTGGPAAMPFMQGWFRMGAREVPGLAFADALPLPRLESQAATLPLLATEDGFVLRLPRRIAPMQPRDVLLARFEVSPGAGREDATPIRADLPFILNADLEWGFDELGARSGDRVSLELLWCPFGWTTDGTLPADGRLDSRALPRRSNRIFVTVP